MSFMVHPAWFIVLFILPLRATARYTSINMKRVPALVALTLVALGALGALYYVRREPDTLTLTGIVTTNDVIVSPQIAGRIGQLLVKEGDVVKRGQLAALLVPDELQQESAFYAHSAEGALSQVQQG